MRYFIIDALNLAYRSHNGFYESKTSKGMLTGMFFGFVRIIFSLKKKYRGYKFEVVWDRKPVHKIAKYPMYKEGRDKLGEEVLSQIPDIQKFLENIGVDQYYKEEQEADDVIASLVEKYEREAEVIIVYSNDKDLLQLVKTGKVVVYKPKVASTPEKFYDEEAVISQFGVPPKKLSCFRSFDGDSSDKIKGVNRVKRKLLAHLVNEYVTIDNIYNNLPGQKLTDFQRKTLLESKERVFLNSELITLNRHIKDIRCIKGVYRKEIVKELLSKYEINSINPDNIIDIFSASVTLKYTDPKDTVRLESFSLF
jgi:DNA polymerase I